MSSVSSTCPNNLFTASSFSCNNRLLASSSNSLYLFPWSLLTKGTFS
ncbi:hypothetical protein [Spiroplasma kunkelii]|nr:hypothetical protein [Spiroplasma kunkelii]